MPKRSTLRTLPAPLRRQLHARLLKADFGDLVALSQWLTKRGFPIAKSALGAYARRHRSEIEAEAQQGAAGATSHPAAPGELQARLVCLDIASRSGAASSVLERAARLLRWAKGQESDPPQRR